ncbi:hypothetical protein Tco_0978013 [Tanacetum coccineum]|uniref:Uncharacterized protein n=1 Tax=Tanacetum coccineum TaxID=301880 RepID=A0ABQ5ELR5_9ASTR
MGLESLDVGYLVMNENEDVFEEDIAIFKCMMSSEKDISIKDFKNHAKDKAGLGYDSQMNESKVVHSVFNSRESDVDDSPVIQNRRAFNQKSAAKTNNLNEKVKTARVNNVTTTGPKAVVSAAKGNGENAVKSSAISLDGNKSFLTYYQEINGGFVAFGGSPKGGTINRKSKIRIGKLDFEDVYFVKGTLSLTFLFSTNVSDKCKIVFFSPKTECRVLSPELPYRLQRMQNEGYANNTNKDSTVSPSVSTAGQIFTNADDFPTDPLMPNLEDTTDLLNTGIFSSAYDDEDVGAEADLNNLETTMNVSPIPTTRIHKDHPKDQIHSVSPITS